MIFYQTCKIDFLRVQRMKCLHLLNSIEGLKVLFDNYGPIIDISLFETRMISTNDPVIAEAFAKESEFITKIISGGLQEIKEFAGSGLFTSNTSDPDWQLAHKLLMPAFSPRAIKVKLHFIVTPTDLIFFSGLST